MIMFINHCHVAPEGSFDKNKPEKGTLKKLKTIMDEVGIEKAIAFAPFLHLMDYDYSWYSCSLKTERECNEWLYQSLKDYPNIFGFVTVNPKNPESCEILAEYINKGFVGAKIHPAIFQIRIDSPSLDKFYSTAEELDIPVLFHTGVHGWKLDQYMPILLDRVAYKHPKLKIIVEHCGLPCFFDQALAVLLNHSEIRKRYNLFAGITGIVGQENKGKILSVIEGIGANHIIYGLDYPFHCREELEKDMEFIKDKLGLSIEESECILGKNLERIIERDVS